VVTFTSAPLKDDLTVTGAPVLLLHLSTTRSDANVIAKLSIQQPQTAEDRAADIQPAATTLAKGWLRASQRALDPSKSLRGEPYVAHTARAPLAPGEVYELTIEFTHMAYRFPAGSRIRLELCCVDSTVTDLQFNHIFTPDMVGTDTYHHDARYPSRLILPVAVGSSLQPS
jgi:predicted acyl esterase